LLLGVFEVGGIKEFVKLYEEVPGVAGHIDVSIRELNGRYEVRINITQSPRFFELSLRNRRVDEVPIVTSRICGVCSMAHLLGSIIALEKALGIDMGENVARLRRVAEAVGIIQNNLVHVLVALPDCLGLRNLIELAKTEPVVVREFLELNTDVLRAYRDIAGRFTHSHVIDVGYQGKLVTKYDLEKAAKLLRTVGQRARKLLAELAGKWRSIEFEDPSLNYLTVGTKEYPIIGDVIAASDGKVFPVGKYAEFIKEEEVVHSNAKYCTYGERPYFVGSRARVLRNYRDLVNEVGDCVSQLRLNLKNPFDNVKAQLIEAIYLADVVERELAELATIVGSGIKLYDLSKLQGSGEAVSAVEAPRGLLIHHYRVAEGRLVAANIITPTVMNSKHMEVCCGELINKLSSEGVGGVEYLRNYTAALIRSYDPCLPCAVH